MGLLIAVLVGVLPLVNLWVSLQVGTRVAALGPRVQALPDHSEHYPLILQVLPALHKCYVTVEHSR